MVQVYHTQTAKRSSCQLWDQHGSLKVELPNNCAAVDKPIAGLLKDLKARGLLEDTLVLWGGEFGRTPTGGGHGGWTGASSIWFQHVAIGGRHWRRWAGGGRSNGRIWLACRGK